LIEAFPESDIVVATFWVTAHDYLSALRQHSRFASVYFIQDYEAWFYDETAYDMRRAVVRTYAEAAHHIVKSRWLKEKVDGHGVSCDIVPLGLDLDVFYPRHRPPSRRPRVISAASADPAESRRGFKETVEIFRRIHAARPDVELMLMGQPPASLPPLPFPYTSLGRLYDPNRVAEAYAAADVLLDASLWQGFGRPGLEAMACGTVPVLTKYGGIVEYARDGHNCFTIDPRDADTAAAAILRLLEDSSLWSRLSANGVTTASGYSHKVEAARHLALYRGWTASRGSITR
jgi:glycosyltransferase involved in cell wall biosynthesis